MGAKVENAMRSAEKPKAKQLTADTDDIQRDARTADRAAARRTEPAAT
jgi:hypothetical protein